MKFLLIILTFFMLLGIAKAIDMPFFMFPKNPNAPTDIVGGSGNVTWQSAATTWQGGAVTW